MTPKEIDRLRRLTEARSALETAHTTWMHAARLLSRWYDVEGESSASGNILLIENMIEAIRKDMLHAGVSRR